MARHDTACIETSIIGGVVLGGGDYDFSNSSTRCSALSATDHDPGMDHHPILVASQSGTSSMGGNGSNTSAILVPLKTSDGQTANVMRDRLHNPDEDLVTTLVITTTDEEEEEDGDHSLGHDQLNRQNGNGFENDDPSMSSTKSSSKTLRMTGDVITR